MKLRTLAAATLLMSGVATSSHALSTIKCIGYTIVLAEDLAIAAEIRAGSIRDMNRIVCEKSASAATDLYEEDNPHRIAVDVPELGVASYVIVFALDNERPDRDDN